MKGIISRLRESGTLTFWLVIVFLIVAGGIASIALPTYYTNAKKQLEPELTVHAQNTFDRTLRVVGDLDYKPFSYFLPNDTTPRGYDIELVSELANRMKVNLELHLMSWIDAVTTMQEEKADMILGCDWQDTAVMACHFTIPTFEEKFVAFGLEPSKSFNDLYNRKIALIEGCGLKETLTRYNLWHNCKEYETVSDCVQAILRGECDCFIAHATIGEVCLRSFGARGKRFRGRMDIASGQMCFGIVEKDQELFEKVNEILLEMRADGTMDRLDQKWLERFNPDVSLGEYMQMHPFILFMTIDLLVIVVLVILVMNHYLIRIKHEKDRAIAAEHSKSFFFSTVSHDIRTPLNAIIGFSELLKNGIEDESERKRALDAVLTSGQTLLDLVNDVLDLSKLDAGKTVFVMEKTDLGHLASAVLHSFDVAVFERDVKLEEQIDQIPLLFIDQHRIRQILFNLIGNAVKFTDHGKIVLSVSFEKNADKQTETGRLTISVSDTGCGIAPDDIENVLKPFVQAKNSGASKGTGLGLSICCQLAERMGGKLTVESVLGKGSTFSVVFPEIRFSLEEKPMPQPDESPVPEPSVNQETAPAIPNDLRILIVDDVPVNTRVIQAMLHRLGITDILTAGNGVEALDILKNDPSINLVLTDMWMPVLDGEGLIREIRSREQWKDLPVYAVTADVEIQKTYKTSGFTGILLKPITIERLRAVLG